MAEFAFNNHYLETTGTSPSFPTMITPQMNFETPINTTTPEENQSQNVTARLQQIHQILKEEVFWAQEHYQENTNCSWIPALHYQTDNKIRLKAEPYRTDCTCRKLY